MLPGWVLSQSNATLPTANDSSGFFSEKQLEWPLAYGPKQKVRDPGRPPMLDAHGELEGYHQLKCNSCHLQRSSNLHTARLGIECRQCHGVTPISSIQHYYSPMNTSRRHAYVCSKCHQGSNASFATYVVHTPQYSRAPEVRESFPALYWADWFMFILIVGVLLVFIPHSIGWWLREWVDKFRNKSEGP